MSLQNDFDIVTANVGLLSDEFNQVDKQHSYINQKIDEMERIFSQKMHQYNCCLDSVEKKLSMAARSQGIKNEDPSEIEEFLQEIKEILLRIHEDIDNKLLIFQQNMKNMSIELNINSKKKLEKLNSSLNNTILQKQFESHSLSSNYPSNVNFSESPYSAAVFDSSPYASLETDSQSHEIGGEKKYVWSIEKIYDKLVKEINGEESCLLSPQIFSDVEGYNYRLTIYLNGYPDYPSYKQFLAIRCRAERDADNVDRKWPIDKLITLVIKNQRHPSDNYSIDNKFDICRTVQHRFDMPGEFLWMDQLVSISEVFGTPPYFDKTDFTIRNKLTILIVFHN